MSVDPGGGLPAPDKGNFTESIYLTNGLAGRAENSDEMEITTEKTLLENNKRPAPDSLPDIQPEKQTKNDEQNTVNKFKITDSGPCYSGA